VELSPLLRLYRTWYIGSGAILFELWSRGASPEFLTKVTEYLKAFWREANSAIEKGYITSGLDLAYAMLSFFERTWRTFYQEMAAQKKPDLTPRIFKQTVTDTMTGWGFWSTYLDALDEEQLQRWPAVRRMLEIYLDFATTYISPVGFALPKGVDWYFNNPKPIEEKEKVVYGEYYMPCREGTYRALWLATGSFLAWLEKNVSWVDPVFLKSTLLPAFAKYLYDRISESLERLDTPDEATEFIITVLKGSGFDYYFGEEDVRAHFLFERFWRATSDLLYLDPFTLEVFLQDDPYKVVEEAVRAMETYGQSWPPPANLQWRDLREPILPESPKIEVPSIQPPPSTGEALSPGPGQETPLTTGKEQRPLPPITIVGEERGVPVEEKTDFFLRSPFVMDWEEWKVYWKRPSSALRLGMVYDFSALQIRLYNISFSVWKMGLVDRGRYPTPESLNDALCQAWLDVTNGNVNEAMLLWDDSKWFQAWNLVMGRA
jgi:hypothetical protein